MSVLRWKLVEAAAGMTASGQLAGAANRRGSSICERANRCARLRLDAAALPGAGPSAGAEIRQAAG